MGGTPDTAVTSTPPAAATLSAANPVSAPGYTAYNPGTAASQYGSYTPEMGYSQLNAAVPQAQTAPQLVGQMNQADQNLPSFLQMNQGNTQLNPQILAQYEQQFNAQNLNPQLAQLQSSLYQGGQGNSTFGGAALGQANAAGAQSAFTAGLGLYQQNLNNFLNERSNYFGNEGQMAQNANNLDVNRGLSVAGMGNAATAAQNQYNLQKGNTLAQLYGSANQNQNQFNLGSYQGQLQQQQNVNAANQTKLGAQNQAFNQWATGTAMNQQASQNRWNNLAQMGSSIIGGL